MASIVFLVGIAGFALGIFVLFYDGIQYLMNGHWDPIQLISIFDSLPQNIAAWANSGGSLTNFLQTTPLCVALVVAGLLLTWLGSALKRRYL